MSTQRRWGGGVLAGFYSPPAASGELMIERSSASLPLSRPSLCNETGGAQPRLMTPFSGLLCLPISAFTSWFNYLIGGQRGEKRVWGQAQREKYERGRQRDIFWVINRQELLNLSPRHPLFSRLTYDTAGLLLLFFYYFFFFRSVWTPSRTEILWLRTLFFHL